jgi:predicted CopG family antitoxin
MAVKTITIDMEAYDLLSRRKKAGQSFSEVIKEHFGGKRTVRDFRNAIGAFRMSERTLDAVDEQVKARRRDKARPIQL